MKLFKSATSASAVAIALAAGTMVVGASTASAVELYKQDGTKIEFTAEIGLGLFHVTRDFSGGFSARPPLNNVSWAEGYAIMGFKFEHAIDANWKAFGAITGVINGNRGDGDALGFEIGKEGDGQLQDAYGGLTWTSGAEGGPKVTLSGGRQKWVLGDGFLIAGDQGTDGRGFGQQYDEGGSYYMNPRRVFAQTAILQVDTGTPIHFDAFYLQSEKAYHGEFGIVGGNLDYVDPKWGTVGVTYIRGVQLDQPQGIFPPPNTQARDGINVYNIHANSSLGIKDFNLAGTFVLERNDDLTANTIGQVNLGPSFTMDAWAWYISPSYTFSNATWTPSVYYRFASFSGDDPNTPGKLEGYDPLYYGATGYNTWFIGEIAANYSGPFSSNVDIHTIGIKTVPNIDVGIGKWTGMSGYLNHYDYRESPNPGNRKGFGTELAVYAEFQLFENLYLSPLYSVLFPENGYKDFYGDDKTVQNFQILGILTY